MFVEPAGESTQHRARRRADEKHTVQLLFARKLDFYAPRVKLTIAACLGLLLQHADCADQAALKRARQNGKTRAKEGGGGEKSAVHVVRFIKVEAFMSGVELCSVPVYEADQVVNVLTRIAKKLGESVVLWKQTDMFTGLSTQPIWSYFDDSIHAKLPTLVDDILRVVPKIQVPVLYKPITSPGGCRFFGVDTVSFVASKQSERVANTFAVWGDSQDNQGDVLYTHRCMNSKHTADITIDKQWPCVMRGNFAVSHHAVSRHGPRPRTVVYVRRVDEATGVFVASVDWNNVDTEPSLQLFWNGKLTVFTGQELMLFDLNNAAVDSTGHDVTPTWVRSTVMGEWRGVQMGSDLGFLVLLHYSGSRYTVLDAHTGKVVTRVHVPEPYDQIFFINSWDTAAYVDKHNCARICRAQPRAGDAHCHHELTTATVESTAMATTTAAKATRVSMAQVHHVLNLGHALVHGPRRLIVNGGSVYRLNQASMRFDLVLRIDLRAKQNRNRWSFNMLDEGDEDESNDYPRRVSFLPRFITDNGKTLCLTFAGDSPSGIFYAVSFPLVLGKSYVCTFKHDKYKIFVEDTTVRSKPKKVKHVHPRT